MTDFPACNLNQPVPVITTVKINPTRADRAVTTVYQFRLHASIHVRYILSFFSKKKEVASLNLRTYTYPTTLTVFLCYSTSLH